MRRDDDEGLKKSSGVDPAGENRKLSTAGCHNVSEEQEEEEGQEQEEEVFTFLLLFSYQLLFGKAIRRFENKVGTFGTFGTCGHFSGRKVRSGIVQICKT